MPKLYKPRSKSTVSAKLFFSLNQHHRAGAVAAHYADLMGQEVSKSVLYARALDMFAEHLEEQLSSKSKEDVRASEREALIRTLY